MDKVDSYGMQTELGKLLIFLPFFLFLSLNGCGGSASATAPDNTLNNDGSSNESPASGDSPTNTPPSNSNTEPNPPEISINAPKINEGNSGHSEIVFILTLKETAQSTFSLDYNTADVSAKAGEDYNTTTGTVDVTAGTEIIELSIPVNGDLDIEQDETFELVVRNPQGLMFRSRATILNDDTAEEPASLSGGYSYSIAVADYEFASIPVVRNEAGVDRFLWEADEDDNSGKQRPGHLTLDSENVLYGKQNLSFTSTSGNTEETGMMVLYYNNWTDSAVNNWRYVRETVAYDQLNKINRMRFWIKLPPSTIKNKNIGSANFHVGTYLRDGDTATHLNESNNWHYYHYYNLEYTDNWQQVIIDAHPHHQRGANGTKEHGILSEPDPEHSPGYNYFDLMTYFYFNLKDYGHAGGGNFYFDNVELYEEPYAEDIAHIYALTGVYSKITGELIVYWSRDKAEDKKTFDVKYAFSSFHKNNGWEHGTLAPGGQALTPPGAGGYNGVEWRSSEIDLGDNDAIYIAIKHEDEANLFRQIRIPLTTSGYPTMNR